MWWRKYGYRIGNGLVHTTLYFDSIYVNQTISVHLNYSNPNGLPLSLGRSFFWADLDFYNIEMIVFFNTLLFFQIYLDIIDIWHCVTSRCTMWWFETCINCEMFSTIMLDNTSFTSLPFCCYCYNEIIYNFLS